MYFPIIVHIIYILCLIFYIVCELILCLGRLNFVRIIRELLYILKSKFTVNIKSDLELK